MTREEAIKFLNNTKVYVNGKSEEIQEKLFSFNFKWCDGSQKVKKVNYPLLFLHNGWISYDNNMIFFTECSYREITIEDILNINIGESKSTYHPFKNDDECWEEMKKHEPFGWVKNINDEKYYVFEVNNGIGTSESFHPYGEALCTVKFLDDTPFGIKLVGSSEAIETEQKNPIDKWHDVNDEPKSDQEQILCLDNSGKCFITVQFGFTFNNDGEDLNWRDFSEKRKIVKWIYINELLTKN